MGSDGHHAVGRGPLGEDADQGYEEDDERRVEDTEELPDWGARTDVRGWRTSERYRTCGRR